MYVVITGVFAIFGSLFCLFVCVRAGVGGRRFGGGGSDDDRGDLGAARKCKEEEVEALKEVTFKAGDEEEGREEGGRGEEGTRMTNDRLLDCYRQISCPVCLEDYEQGETLKVLGCGHFFHKECIGKWLTGVRGECPVCKHRVGGCRGGGGATGETL